MSKLCLVLLLSMFAVALSAPPFQINLIVRQRNTNDGSGVYEFFYELANGQFFEEKGYLKEDGSQVKEGSYSFVDPDGNTQTVNYSADDTGFHPVIGINPNVLKTAVG